MRQQGINQFMTLRYDLLEAEFSFIDALVTMRNKAGLT